MMPFLTKRDDQPWEEKYKFSLKIYIFWNRLKNSRNRQWNNKKKAEVTQLLINH